MKPVVIGVILAIIILVAIFTVGINFLSSLSLSQLFKGGASPSPSPPPNIPPTPSPPKPPPATTPSGTTPVPSSTPTQPAANVNFEVVVTNVSGTGLSRTITAQITNTGTADAHNVWVKAEVFSQGQRIQVSGQDYLRVDIGTIKAGATATAQETLSFNLLDGLKIQQNGAQIVLTIYSDERTQTLTYDYKP